MCELELKDVCLADGGARSAPLTARLGKGSCCLVGGDGALLTRLTDAVVGLGPVASGYVTIDGEPVTQRSAPAFRHLFSYIPHDVHMPPLTVGSLVDSFCRLGLNRRVKVERSELLTLWEEVLPDAPQFDDRADALSPGRLRRLMLSMAWLFGRPILVADQIADGMTADEAALATSFLRRLADRGTALLLTAAEDDTALGRCAGNQVAPELRRQPV